MANHRKHFVCIVPGCGAPHDARGYCLGHYQRFRVHGDPLGGGPPRRYALDWVAEHLSYQGDDCLIWPFYRKKDGRGNIYANGSVYGAHRYICEQVNGPPPSPEYETLHKCGGGRHGCVNPKHLRWGTRAENVEDKQMLDEQPFGARNASTKLTEQDVRAIRNLYPATRISDLARLFNVTPPTVRALVKGRTWRWVAD